MSIDSISTASLSALETQQKIAYRVAAKQLDAVEQQGDAVVQLIEAARGSVPGLGARLDVDA